MISNLIYTTLFKFIPVLCSFMMLISCNKKIEKENYTALISSLKTDEQKEAFLFEVFQDDQKLRNQSNNVLKESNYDMSSKEYLQHIDKMNLIDSINYEKVMIFLEIHGYPDFEFKHELASYSITAVAIHQPYNNQLKILPYLKKAYYDKLLSSKNFSSFLNRMHINKFGQSFPILNPESAYIEELLKKVDPNTKS